MAFNETQAAWLEGLSGLSVAKERSDAQRKQKALLALERQSKLATAKDSVKNKFKGASYKDGVFTRKQVLDEKGGQEAEFDYSNLKGDRQFEQAYLDQMQEAMEQLSQTMAEMRDAQTELVDEATGAVVLDDKGQPVMVPLYTDEQIAEEVYMPLVRERLMPEWLVPNKWSKTQQMLDASDALYKERLRDYTEQLDAEEQSLLDDAKSATTRLGGLAQKALAMVPGAPAELASSIVGIVTLGVTTGMTAAQVLTKAQIDRSLLSVIDNVGQIMSQSIGAATGQPAIGELAGNLFKTAVTSAKMTVCLAQDPPDVGGAIGEFANGLEAALGSAFAGKDLGGADPSLVSQACSKSAVQLFRAIASGLRIREHVLNGDSDAIVAELTAASKEALGTVVDIVSAAQSEGRDTDAAQAIKEKQQAIEGRIKDGIDLAAAGISTGVKVVDAVRVKGIRAMAGEIVDSVGDVLGATLNMAAPEVGDAVGNAYRESTKAGLVAYYLTMDPPDSALALQSLAEGFNAAFALANPDDDPALKRLSSALANAFVTAGSSIDLAGAIAADKYNDVVKALAKLARSLLSKALKVDTSGDPSVTAEGTQGSELVEGIVLPDEAFAKLDQSVTKAVQGLNDDKVKARLQQALDDMRSAEALAEIESAREEVERMLIQADEGGGKAADTRSIENLISAMQRDRLIMEMALKLMGAGTVIVEQFVAPMAIGGAAVKLAANLIKAAQRASTLAIWVGNQSDMHKAVSSFESSAANFVKNQAEQFSHYAIQAALELARMIGEIVSCTGISSAAGVALAKGAALAIAAEDISYQFYKKADLENAWRVTKKAWLHPESRKLGLQARRLNPTLAKYTLAWGAAVKRDALAQEAVRTCGLNALTLSQKDSNVSQVQKYLELYFNEDNIVLKRFTTAEWMPATVELAVRSWTIAKSRGETLGGVTVADAAGVDEALRLLEQLGAEFNGKVAEIRSAGFVQAERDGLYGALDELRKRYRSAADRFATLLNKYQPTDKNNKLHREMDELKGQFRLAAVEAEAEVDSTWQELSDRLEAVRPAPVIADLFAEPQTA